MSDEEDSGDKKKKKTKRTKSSGPSVDWMGNVIGAGAEAADPVEVVEALDDATVAAAQHLLGHDTAALLPQSVSSVGSEGSVSGEKRDRLRTKSGKKSASANFSFGEAGKAAVRDQNEGEALDEHLEYRERHIPQVRFDWPGFIYYLLLLSFFMYHTLGGRDYAFYYTEYAREIGDVEHFMKIDSSLKYQDWLETAFFPNIHYNSVNRSYAGAPGITLIGPPRIRTVRAKGAYGGAQPSDGSLPRPGDCGQAEETAGLAAVCFDLAPEEMETADERESTWFDALAPWWSDGTVGDAAPMPEPEPELQAGAEAGRVVMQYYGGEELEENVYSSYTGVQYPSGGHIVRNLHTIFREAPSVYKMGSELYPWARYQTPVQPLLDAGLLHPATRVVMHDFTIYSATKDAYVNVRLVVEIGLEHGMFIPSKHVRLVWLTNFPESRVVFEVAFYILLIGLALEMGHEWVTKVLSCEVTLQENMAIAKFELQFEICRQAAFKSIFAYRPKALLEQLKLKVSAVPAERKFHISELNRLGKQLEKLHQHAKEFSKGNAKSDNAVDKAEAILQVLSDLADVKTRQQQLDVLASEEGGLAMLARCRVRCKAATDLFLEDMWRVIDLMNYGVFFMTFFIMLKVFTLMDKAHNDVMAVDRNDPWTDENYVGFYRVSYWTNTIQRYAYALNTVLTWIKCFKFLAYFPSMEMLTRTMGYASGPLWNFSVIMMIVLFAFGQAFFLSFGLDVFEYRTMFTSFFALLRMGVGDYEYSTFEQSHPKVGPALFWMYIFVVFFVLMSVFIALISESYEQAKQEIETIESAGNEGPPLLTGSEEDPQNAVGEARERLASIAPRHVSKLLVEVMQGALPADGDTAAASPQSPQKKLAAKWQAKLQASRDHKKWTSGPLTEHWERPKGARALDYMEGGEMDWLKRLRPGVTSKMKMLSNRAKKKVADRGADKLPV